MPEEPWQIDEMPACVVVEASGGLSGSEKTGQPSSQSTSRRRLGYHPLDQINVRGGKPLGSVGHPPDEERPGVIEGVDCFILGHRLEGVARKEGGGCLGRTGEDESLRIGSRPVVDDGRRFRLRGGLRDGDRAAGASEGEQDGKKSMGTHECPFLGLGFRHRDHASEIGRDLPFSIDNSREPLETYGTVRRGIRGRRPT